MKASKLIKASRYPIRINNKLSEAIDIYCQSNNISDETKAKIQILTGFVYDRQLIFDSTEICVPQNLLRKLFSNKKYQEILKHCENATLTLTRNANAMSKTAKHYKIKPDLFDNNTIVSYPNVSKRYENVLNRNSKEKNDKILELDNFFSDSRVELQNQFLNAIKKKYSQEKVDSFSKSLIEKGILSNENVEKYRTMFLCDNPYIFNVCNIDKDGRIYNIFTFCKREYRDLIKDDFVEVDISNSHPFILGSLLKNLSEGNNLDFLDRKLTENEQKFKNSGLNNENEAKTNLLLFNSLKLINKNLNYSVCPKNQDVEKIKNILFSISNCVHFNSKNLFFRDLNIEELNIEILNFEHYASIGNFYLMAKSNIVQNHKNIQFKPLLNCIEIGKKEIKKYKENMIPENLKKDIMKKSFMYWMNGSNENQRLKITRLFPLLYPNITKLFRILKNEFGKTSIHGLITTIESDLVYTTIERCNKNTKPFVVGSVHDAFFVEKEKLELLVSIFEKTSMEFLNNIPKNKTK
ncbi:MAG: hypothetical protein ACOYO1_07310 [Bacteroidales bacterium]